MSRMRRVAAHCFTMRLKSAGLGVLFACSGSFQQMSLENGPQQPAPGMETISDSGTPLRPPADAGILIFEIDAGIPAADAGRDPIDAGPADPRVPVFFGVGKLGRRTLSCDDGKTWINDSSRDDRAVCFTAGLDCDHEEFSATALLFTGESFLHASGWGKPGHIWQSTDTVNWKEVDQGHNLQGLMHGNGKIIAATRSSIVSDDLGKTWNKGPELDLNSNGQTIYNIRGGAFGGVGQGAFVVTANDGNAFDSLYSLDNGKSWKRSVVANGGSLEVCGTGTPVFGNGKFVMVRRNAPRPQDGQFGCVSEDSGATWSPMRIGDGTIESSVVFHSGQFMGWSKGVVHTSADGKSWKSEPTFTIVNGNQQPGPAPGPVAVNAIGTFVAVNGGWNQWYDKQHFYRSLDGVTWEELKAGAFKKSHPMSMLTAGLVPLNTVCR